MATISLLFVWNYLIRRLILTNDESGEIEDKSGKIEIMPVWKWLLQ